MSASRALSCSLSGTQVSPTWTLPSTMIAMSTCLAPSGMGSGSSVCGSWTGLPSISSGVTTMKMISSTRQTSTSGVTLISDLTARSEEHTSELQSQSNLVCRLLLEKKKTKETWTSNVTAYWKQLYSPDAIP